MTDINLTKAAELFNDAISLVPNMGLYQYHLGLNYFKSENYELAKPFLKSCLEADIIGTFTKVDKSSCAAKLAIIYAEKDNDSETAISYMGLCLKLNPSSSFKLAGCTEDCPWSMIVHGNE